MREALHWLLLLLPPPRTAFSLAALGFAGAWALGMVCGGLKLRRGWPTAYTRKLFHLVVFSASAWLQLRHGLAALDAFALGIAAAVLLAVARGPGHAFFEALARESDAPHGRFFVVVPLLTTAAGGLIAALTAGDAAALGVLAAGWGDAAGEPVGRRFGRHAFRVPGPLGVRSVRTLEGSSGVAAVAAAAAALALLLTRSASPGDALRVGLAVGIATAAVEAISPHGLDNLTTIPAAAWVAASFT
jgi:phytol kinase